MNMNTRTPGRAADKSWHTRALAAFRCLLVTGIVTACIPDLGEELAADVDGEPGSAGSDGAAGQGGQAGQAGQAGQGGAAGAGGSLDGLPDPLIDEGEVVFFTAGGRGCSSCHGDDANGATAPRIVGASRTAIVRCLDTVDEMSFLRRRLTELQIDAVAAYLASLTASR